MIEQGRGLEYKVRHWHERVRRGEKSVGRPESPRDHFRDWQEMLLQHSASIRRCTRYQDGPRYTQYRVPEGVEAVICDV